MDRKSRFICLLTFHLFFQLILTLISSINLIFLIISLLINLVVILKEKSKFELFVSHYYSSLMYVLFHYIVFTLSYAEILPWETGLVIFLIVLIIYYNKKLSLLTSKSYFNCFPFEKYKEEFDCNINLLVMKYLLTNICLYLYTFHLCLTTICTPEMYFNWFLIIKNCRFTYSTLHSSYTLSGGILVSLTWSIISIYYLIQNRFR